MAKSGDLVVGRVNQKQVIIPESALVKSQRVASHMASLLGYREIESSLAAYWSLETRDREWQILLGLCPNCRSTNNKVLEIGSGMGLFTIVGQFLGINCVGVEPGDEKYDGSVLIAHEALRANQLSESIIKKGYAEQLPFQDEEFDCVCSFQTIEHVNDPRLMLTEAYRVLKPGGILLLECPNYNYPLEVHYGVAVPTFFGRTVTKLFLWLQQRPIHFLKHVNWVTPQTLQTWLLTANFEVEFIGPKIDVQELELDIVSFPIPFNFHRNTWGSRFVKKAFGVNIVKQFGIKLGCYSLITCVARKSA